MKRFAAVLFFFIAFLYNGYARADAAAAVVLEAQTGRVLYAVNEMQTLPMASTTKIMTALVALENADLSDIVTTGDNAYGVPGTSIYLQKGEQLTLEQMLYGLMLASGNDAAVAIAEHVGGSVSGFCDMMNARARQIGCENTHFVTPHGLPAQQHYTTAYDMALLGSYAVKKPAFRSLCSCKTKTVSFDEPDIKVTFTNHNRLLSSYEGAFGIKTGFTKKSGRCLVSAAERNGICFVCVTLNDGDDWNDHRKMLDFAFESVSTQTVDVKDTYSVPVEGGAVSSVSLIVKAEFFCSVSGEKKNIEARVCLPKFVYAPLMKGDAVGKIEYYADGRKIAEQNLVCPADVAAAAPKRVQKKSFIRRILEKLNLIGDP